MHLSLLSPPFLSSQNEFTLAAIWHHYRFKIGIFNENLEFGNLYIKSKTSRQIPCFGIRTKSHGNMHAYEEITVVRKILMGNFFLIAHFNLIKIRSMLFTRKWINIHTHTLPPADVLIIMNFAFHYCSTLFSSRLYHINHIDGRIRYIKNRT